MQPVGIMHRDMLRAAARDTIAKKMPSSWYTWMASWWYDFSDPVVAFTVLARTPSLALRVVLFIAAFMAALIGSIIRLAGGSISPSFTYADEILLLGSVGLMLLLAWMYVVGRAAVAVLQALGFSQRQAEVLGLTALGVGAADASAGDAAAGVAAAAGGSGAHLYVSPTGIRSRKRDRSAHARGGADAMSPDDGVLPPARPVDPYNDAPAALAAATPTVTSPLGAAAATMASARSPMGTMGGSGVDVFGRSTASPAVVGASAAGLAASLSALRNPGGMQALLHTASAAAAAAAASPDASGAGSPSAAFAMSLRAQALQGKSAASALLSNTTLQRDSYLMAGGGSPGGAYAAGVPVVSPLASSTGAYGSAYAPSGAASGGLLGTMRRALDAGSSLLASSVRSVGSGGGGGGGSDFSGGLTRRTLAMRGDASGGVGGAASGGGGVYDLLAATGGGDAAIAASLRDSWLVDGPLRAAEARVESIASAFDDATGNPYQLGTRVTTVETTQVLPLSSLHLKLDPPTGRQWQSVVNCALDNVRTIVASHIKTVFLPGLSRNIVDMAAKAPHLRLGPWLDRRQRTARLMAVRSGAEVTLQEAVHEMAHRRDGAFMILRTVSPAERAARDQPFGCIMPPTMGAGAGARDSRIAQIAATRTMPAAAAAPTAASLASAARPFGTAFGAAAAKPAGTNVFGGVAAATGTAAAAAEAVKAAKAAAARAESDRADAAAGRIGTKEPVNLWYERALYEAFLAVPGMSPADPRGEGVDPRGYVLQRLQQWTAGLSRDLSAFAGDGYGSDVSDDMIIESGLPTDAAILVHYIATMMDAEVARNARLPGKVTAVGSGSGSSDGAPMSIASGSRSSQLVAHAATISLLDRPFSRSCLAYGAKRTGKGAGHRTSLPQGIDAPALAPLLGGDAADARERALGIRVSSISPSMSVYLTVGDALVDVGNTQGSRVTVARAFGLLARLLKTQNDGKFGMQVQATVTRPAPAAVAPAAAVPVVTAPAAATGAAGIFGAKPAAAGAASIFGGKPAVAAAVAVPAAPAAVIAPVITTTIAGMVNIDITSALSLLSTPSAGGGSVGYRKKHSLLAGFLDDGY